MDLEESLDIILDVLEEYMDSRTYNRYLLDNILLALNGKAVSYKDYIKMNSKSITKTNKNENEIINENNNMLKDFLNKRKGGK